MNGIGVLMDFGWSDPSDPDTVYMLSAVFCGACGNHITEVVTPDAQGE